MKNQLLYIGGAGRSGSTLLDLILNNNDQIQSVGEFHRLSWYAQTDWEYCTCGQPVMECPFWLHVQSTAMEYATEPLSATPLQTLNPMLRPEDLPPLVDNLEKALLVLGSRPLFMGYLKILGRPHYHALKNSLFWYEMIRRSTGKPIILDSTKDPRRLKALYFVDPEKFKLIYLVRDGRAVAASAMRRVGVDMATAASSWLEANKRSQWAQKGIPEEKIYFLRYEDLCGDPEKGVRNLCQFIGVPFDESMLVLEKKVSHNIGGNPMRFRQEESKIFLDERWREELTEQHLDVFQIKAGKLNQQFGYE